MPASSLSLKSALQVAPPSNTWRFRVYMPNDNGTIIAEEFGFISPNIGAIPRYGRGTMLYYPGAVNISAAGMSFYEDENYSVLDYLYEWWHNVYDPRTGNYGLPGTYKKQIIAKVYDLIGNERKTYTLDGAWPTEIAPIQYSYNDSNRVIIQATFSLDGNDKSSGSRSKRF